MKKYDAAVWFVQRGFAVYPVWTAEGGRCGCGRQDCPDVGKHPHARLIGDRPKGEGGLKAATADLAAIESWWTADPNANVGIRTGKVSGVLVLDIDGEQGEASLDGLEIPPTWEVRTGGGGRHLFFRYPDTGLDRIPSPSAFLEKVDLRADDAGVVAPPSCHRSGNAYRWVKGRRPDQAEIADCPAWLVDEIIGRYGPSASTEGKATREPAAEIARGSGPQWLTDLRRADRHLEEAWTAQLGLPSLSEHRLAVAKALAGASRTDAEISEALVAFDAFHGRSPEPKATYDREAAKGKDEGGKTGKEPGQAVKLMKMARSKVAEFFTDVNGNVPFAKYPLGNGHYAIAPLVSGDGPFYDWISWSFCEGGEDPPGDSSIKQAITQLRRDASIGERRRLELRTAWYNDSIWIDFGDLTWRAIRVSPGEWDFVDEPPTLFRRAGHMLPLAEPVRPGDVRPFLDFCNLPSGDDESRMLLAVYLVSCWIPGIDHPMLVVTGPEGSGKTTVFRYLRRIVDASSLESVMKPKKAEDLRVYFYDNAVAPIDNVSVFSRGYSDDICPAITGASVVARKLYANFDAATISYRRCILVNGIASPARMKDLISRCLRLELPAMAEGGYRSRLKMDAEFEAAAGTIVAGCLDALAKAMAMPSPELPWRSRLTDFTDWGYRIAEALGWSGPAFLAAYRRNIDRQRAESLTVFESVVVDFVEKESHWEGKVSDLLQELSAHAADTGIDTSSSDITWPRSPTLASTLLQEAEATLRGLGVEIIFHPRTSAGSHIELRKVGEEGAVAPAPSFLDLPAGEWDLPAVTDDDWGTAPLLQGLGAE